MATSTPQKWLIGCGIGCAVVVVLIVGLVTGAVVFVRGKFYPLQQASDSRKEVVAAYGIADAFVPPANGVIDPARMDVFLSVRGSLREAHTRLDTALTGFDFDRLNQRQPSIGAVFRLLSDLSNLIAPIGGYVARRNQVLLEKRMGLGEYAYIYSIAYHSWLGHPPEEGPSILANIRRPERERLSRNDVTFSPESMRRQYRRLILRMLENQLESIRDAGQKKWREALRLEIGRIENDPDRVAWQDNLPVQVEACLKPFRDRLVDTYHRSANCFELLTIDEFSQLQWSGPSGELEVGSGRGTGVGPVEVPEPGPGSSTGLGSDTAGRVTYLVGGGVTTPESILQPAPPYTEEARKARIEGVVTIQALVRANGSLDKLKVIRTLGHGLDESAMNTLATKWRFKPGTRNGAPVEVQARIDVTFRLH
jgi:TonB family protein